MQRTIAESWQRVCHKYRRDFDEPVPDWVCVYDLRRRLMLVVQALRIGWKLPQRVLIPDEVHWGRYGLWDDTP